MTNVTVANTSALSEKLREGIAHHRAGRLGDAEAAYKHVLAAQPNHPEALHLLGVIARQVRKYPLAESLLNKAIAIRPEAPEYHDHLGGALHEQGKLDAAVAAYRRALELKPGDARLVHNLGNALKDLGRIEEAIATYRKALELKPDFAHAVSNLGLAYKLYGDPDRAIECYQRAIELKPDFPEVHNNLGNVLKDRGRLDEAVAAYRKALELKPDFAEAHNNLGAGLQDQGDHETAATAFRRALELKPNFAEAHYNLGNALLKLGKKEEALAAYEQTLAVRPNYFEARYNQGNVLLDLSRWEEAVAAYRQALEIKPDYHQAYYNMGNAFKEDGRLDDAIAAYRKAHELRPEYLRARWGAELSVPILYDNEDEIAVHRARWEEGIARISESLDLGTEELREEAVEALLSRTNFYLNYQGYNDREQQMQFGALLARIAAAAYPEYTEPLPKRKIGPDEKIRVGFVSSHLYHHSVYKTRGGWIKYLDRDRFDVYTFYTGDKTDHASEDIKKSSNIYYGSIESHRAVLEEIRGSDLDALIFPDVGMDPKMQLFAALRLAPVQGMGWAHPVTSGIPNMDYFISNELMEPDNPEVQYSEELVLLPNLGICYPYPILMDKVPADAKRDRPEGSFIYLCSQSLFKLLPQHDEVYARILARVPNSQIWFIEHQRSKRVTEQFRRRMGRALAAHGLDVDERCVIHPRMNFLEFLTLNHRADVLLDSIAWSGCNTTFEGIASGLPVITLPGTLMRARHTYGILKMIGIDDTVAGSKDEYVELAVRMAEDAAWREEMTGKVRERHRTAFEDMTPVRAFGEWLERVCSAAD